MSQSNSASNNTDNPGVTYYSAAAAGVAQAISMDAQNLVEQARIQGIIKATAMGNTYAKWLANPSAGEQLFKPILDSLKDSTASNPSPLMGTNSSQSNTAISTEIAKLCPYVATTMHPESVTTPP